MRLEQHFNPSYKEIKQMIAEGKKPLIMYHLSKEEVENKDLKGIDKIMNTVHKVGKGARQCVVITCGGYDDVPDELWEIPAVREFVKHMFNKYPHILYYINTKFEADHWLLASLLDIQALLVGEKLNSHEIWEKYGFNAPRYSARLFWKKEHLIKTLKAIIAHGKRQKDAKGAKRVALEYALRLSNDEDILEQVGIKSQQPND